MESVVHIPDRTVNAGMPLTMELGAYFPKTQSDTIQFSAENMPAAFELDPRSGRISGRAPIVVTDVVYSFTVKAHYVNAEQTLTGVVNLTVQAAIPQEPMAEGELLKEAYSDMSYMDAMRKWELEQFVEFFIREHFAYISVTDAGRRKTKLGNFISQRTAQTGWTILNFENYLMITPGNMAFEDFGNRGRLIDTVREMYKKDLPQKAWKQLRLEGSDLESLGKAWIIAAEMELNAGDPPTDAAVYSYRNIMRLKQPIAVAGEKPVLPG